MDSHFFKNIPQLVVVHTVKGFSIVSKAEIDVFSAKMGSIKDRNGMDLTEADNINNRWQEYTELYKKTSSQPI